MGQAVAALALRQGHGIHTTLDSTENIGGRALTRDRLSGSDVAIEFTRPDSVERNLEKLIEIGIPTVTGTTGWLEALPRITRLVQARRGALLHAANFSIGVHLFLRSARELARNFRAQPQFAESISEEHHVTKLDAPSGTALMLQRQLRETDDKREYPIASVRAGSNTGRHTILYESPHETIMLSHVARDREAFATGAIMAAEWLVGRTGVFTFEDVLFGETA